MVNMGQLVLLVLVSLELVFLRKRQLVGCYFIDLSFYIVM